MSNISVQATWMEHEGGTKFYQVFFIRSEKTGRAVSVNHWGSIGKLGALRFHRPVNGGDTQVKPGHQASVTISAKQKRGYSVVDTAEFPICDAEELEQRFGADLTHNIQVALMMMLPADDSPTDETETIPKVAKAPEPEPERPASWGRW